MIEKRYFERMWEEEYYIFDSETISEDEFDEKVEYEDYQAFADSMLGDEVVNKLNQLNDENEQLKSDLDYFKAKNGSLETRMFNLERENEQLKQEIIDLRIKVLDSIHEADEVQCSCSPCIVEEYVKKVVKR